MPDPIPADTLVYGMQLPIQSQSTIYAEPWEASAGAAELAAVARAADRNGFWYLAVCDHVAIPRPLDEKMGTSWWDTIATLGWLAGITEHVRLMSHVYVLPYRHPLMAAKAFLTLDELSGGRAVLGVGAGHVQAEFELLGVDFEHRGSALDDAIDVVRAAFTDEYPDGVDPDGDGGRCRAAPPCPPGRWAAHLGGRIVASRPAPRRRQGRRLAAPGAAARRGARRHRLDGRAPPARTAGPICPSPSAATPRCSTWATRGSSRARVSWPARPR